VSAGAGSSRWLLALLGETGARPGAPEFVEEQNSLGSPAVKAGTNVAGLDLPRMKDPEARGNARGGRPPRVSAGSSAWFDIRELEREAEALGEWMDEGGPPLAPDRPGVRRR
jgi:hypothetical protein